MPYSKLHKTKSTKHKNRKSHSRSKSQNKQRKYGVLGMMRRSTCE